jgi:hypothetical protein
MNMASALYTSSASDTYAFLFVFHLPVLAVGVTLRDGTRVSPGNFVKNLQSVQIRDSRGEKHLRSQAAFAQLSGNNPSA